MFAGGFTLFALNWCFLQRGSAADSAPRPRDSTWFIGCVNASGSLHPARRVRDLDPVNCCARCLDEGFDIAALNSDRCCCGKQLQGLTVSECFRASSPGGSQGVTGEGEESVLEPPIGSRFGNLTIYRTEGPFLHHVSLSTSPDRVYAGKKFVLEFSGKLAGSPDQPTGIEGFGEKNLSYVTVEFRDTTSTVQNSQHVHVLDDGFVGDPVTLQAHVTDGTASEFYWWFSEGRNEFNMAEEGSEKTGVKTVCPPNSDCLNSTVIWTFTTEGIHTVSVNASTACGWLQETMYIMAVRQVVSDLDVSVPGNTLKAGASVLVDVKLLTTMKHLLLLNVTLNADENRHHKGKGTDGCSHSDDIQSYKRNENEQENDICNHGNSQETHDNAHSNIYCHGNTPPNPLHLLHTSNDSSCHLHLHLHCRLSIAPGQYHLSASLLSSTQPSSALLFTLLPRALVVYERIRALRPSGRWMSVVAAQSEFSLEVVSCAEAKVVWTFSLNDAVVMNRTTEQGKINVSLPVAGRYRVTVKAFNPVSWASFHAQISAQSPVGELCLKAPRVITTDQKHYLLFSVTAGSDLTVSLWVNATCVYMNGNYTTPQEAAVALLIHHAGTVVVELRAENQVSSQNKSLKVCVLGKQTLSPQFEVNPPWQPPTSQSSGHDLDTNVVRIYASSRAYRTNTDVTFLAVADVPDAAEFLWYFGDSTSATTTSGTVTKRYYIPGRYDVVVMVSRGQTSLTSEAFPLVVQRAVKLNRLVHWASVLRNQTVTLSCRVNVGTDLSFLWSFGDGTTTFGQSTEQHVFHRTGEFTVEVTVSNLVSSASVSNSIFVVDRTCLPPPVKHMGPLKVQVQRYAIVRLGVTYDSDVDCDVKQGLHYSWTLFDSAGQIFPLTPTDTHRQTLVLPSHLLGYDTYTATARVQVVGSVVYSNYSVRVQVMPSSPVASVQGGTNMFINNRNITMVTLDGRRSYYPDFPLSPISFSWTCQPVSSIPTSCFSRHVNMSSAVLAFPASDLKQNFDQFRFTLAVHSMGRSASSDTFVTVTSHAVGTVDVHCPQCRGDRVNWDQWFSVTASCADCGVSPEHIWYSWSLFVVNASSKPIVEVPFCYTVDLSVPSTIMESLSSSPPPTPVTSNQHPPPSDAPRYARAVRPASVSLTENMFESSASTGEELFFPRGNPTLHPDSGGIHFHQSDITDDLPTDSDSSFDGHLSFPAREAFDTGDLDYDIPVLVAEEGDPGISAGRPTAVDGDSLSPPDSSEFNPASHDHEESHLVDLRPSVMTQAPTLLDLPRHPVDTALFESYTFTGLSSPSLRFRPFSLRPGSRYMLDVTAKSQQRFLGRTQLFLQTNPAPEGVTCQVQPVKGTELYTHFSIFCTSGREDLLYEYSFNSGNRPPRMLYQGQNFQYYFSLPSGDHSDDYNVTIYTRIRSSRYGTATRLCPVTVRVQPSFLRDTSSPDPDLKLSESGLKNLSALVQLGNSAEIRNYISLLSSILNRLSQDAEANRDTQRRMRTVLICTVCQLEHEQASMEDNICILKDLLQVTSQVTSTSVKRVTAHVQAVAEQLPTSSAAVGDRLHQEMLSNLLTVLSYGLQAAGDMTPEIDSDLPAGEHFRDACGAFKTSTMSVQQVVDDVLQTVSDLILRYIVVHKLPEHRVDTALMSLHAARQNQSFAVVRGSATIYTQHLFARRGGECVLSLLTEFAHSPFTSARWPAQMCGPVVDLSLHQCSTRRKIPVRSLVQPIVFELQLPRKQETSADHYVLLRSSINYHSFNITQQLLQQVVQLSVAFTTSPNKTSPIMLLFRMFERPTPSMHHLLRIHHWESDTARITLPPSYLSAAGVGYLALLNADFKKPLRHKHSSHEVHYSLTVHCSRCYSWDGHQGVWTHLGCTTQQLDGSAAVNCSCHHLRPLTVIQEVIHSSHDTADLDLFLSTSNNITVMAVLLLCVCLYGSGLLVCMRADVASEESQSVHYLCDNSPGDSHLYAVTVHTGLQSAARMSAKVYMVLHGEDGVSQTGELHVPGCTLFRRNSQDTFILSTADSLGAVRGVHIWHDNSGPSPSWYLKLVEVSELGGGARSWLFVGQCWLAVHEGDGQVERVLRVCTRGINLAKMLCLKLSDYMADFHIWISVFCCPRPNSFTRAQRLSVCLMLLSGYACASAVIVSQMDELLLFEAGIIAASAVSMTTGALTVVAGLPAATLISFLFRLREVKLQGFGIQRSRKTESSDDASHRSSLQQWEQEAWKHQGTEQLGLVADDRELKNANAANQTQVESCMGMTPQRLTDGGKLDERKEPDSETEREREGRIVSQKEMDHQGKCPADVGMEEGSFQRVGCSEHSGGLPSLSKLRGRRVRAEQWCHLLAWTLCLLLSLFCLVLSAVLGLSFSSSKALLWIQSLFFSLLLCIFLIQPAALLAAAVVVSLWRHQTPDFHKFSRITELEVEMVKPYNPEEQRSSARLLGRGSHLDKVLGARRRARFLRLVRPPTPAELRQTRRKKRREMLMGQTIRDLSLSVSMIVLMLFVTSSSSFRDYYHLNKAVRQQVIGRTFVTIHRCEDWWKWTQSHLLSLLYKNSSAKFDGVLQTHVLIGEPVLWKKDVSRSFHCQSSAVAPECVSSASTSLRSDVFLPHGANPKTSGGLCSQSTTVELGRTESEATFKLKVLRSEGWLRRETVALKVQFTLFSPAPNLFTTVTLFAERSPSGTLLPSAKVQSVRIYHAPTVWNYVALVCQLLFLLLSLLLLCLHVCTVGQQGLMGYCRTPCNWLDVTLLTVTLLYYVHCIHHSVLVVEVVERLETHRGHVDISVLATKEQSIRSLQGILLLLLTLKCVTALRVVSSTGAASATLSARSLSLQTVSGLIMFAAISSLQTLLCHNQDRSHLTSGHDVLLDRVPCLYSVMWTAVVTGLAFTYRKNARAEFMKDVFTVAELTRYVRQRVWEFTGHHSARRPGAERRTYYLEEFDSLLDELLFRLNALSNSLHHTLPPKAQRPGEDSPVPSLVQDSQNVARTNLTESMLENMSTDRSNRRVTAPLAHLLRVAVRSSQRTDILSCDGTLMCDNSQPCGVKAGGRFLMGQNFLSLPSSSSPMSPAGQSDELETQTSQRTETSYWSGSALTCRADAHLVAQTAHTEVLVEALVHDEPDSWV